MDLQKVCMIAAKVLLEGKTRKLSAFGQRKQTEAGSTKQDIIVSVYVYANECTSYLL